MFPASFSTVTKNFQGGISRLEHLDLPCKTIRRLLTEIIISTKEHKWGVTFQNVLFPFYTFLRNHDFLFLIISGNSTLCIYLNYIPYLHTMENSTIWPTLEIVRFVQFEELVRFASIVQMNKLFNMGNTTIWNNFSNSAFR